MKFQFICQIYRDGDFSRFGLDFWGLAGSIGTEVVLYRFISSFFTNAALAALLAYLGDILGVDIYIGAVVAFSIRLFQNLSMIREELFERFWWWHVGGNGKDV